MDAYDDYDDYEDCCSSKCTTVDIALVGAFGIIALVTAIIMAIF